MSDQNRLMLYCPASCEERPYPSDAEQWRQYHGKAAWLFNPWTGNRRNAADVGTDPFGLLIVPLQAEIHPALESESGSRAKPSTLPGRTHD